MILNIDCNYCGKQLPLKEAILLNKKSLWFCEPCIRELYEKGIKAKSLQEIENIKSEYGI